MTRSAAGVLFLATLALALWGRPLAPSRDRLILSGNVFGTVYRVTVAPGQVPAARAGALDAALHELLAFLERTFSVFDPESELSRFNAWEHTTPFPVSGELAVVVEAALDVAVRSGGAFDPTVAPWIDLWGFGPSRHPTRAPGDEDIAALRGRVGYRHLVLLPGPFLSKAVPELSLNLGGVAKGYGVDRVVEWLQALGIRHAVVEIGGDTRMLGRADPDRSWRVGLQQPFYASGDDGRLAGILHPASGAIATSGDYRQHFHDAGGQLRSHVIDPRTGRPVEHALASVTVWAPTCLRADAWATALMVLGAEEGLAAAEREPDLEAWFIERDGKGGWTRTMTSGFVGTTGFQPGS